MKPKDHLYGGIEGGGTKFVCTIGTDPNNIHAQALANYSFVLSPQRIIIGGGVGSLSNLLPKIQQKTREQINGYIQSPVILKNIESYVVLPSLGNRSGMLGAVALAEQVLQKS